jgi:hypothetical protein
MNFSRSLQAALRTDVLDAYLQDLGRFQFNESIAALLVWSSIPISTSTNFEPGTSRILFNFDIDVFWSWQNPNLRRGFANNSQTLAALSGRLAEIQSRLLDGGK